MDIIITILVLIIIFAVMYNYFTADCIINKNIFEAFTQDSDVHSEFQKSVQKCNLDNINIDDLVIIKREPVDIKLINENIKKKSFMFTDDEIKSYQNPNQIYNVKNNDIKNISEKFYVTCKNDATYNYSNNIIEDDITEYTNLEKKLYESVEETNKIDCENIKNLIFNKTNNRPKYMNNYYWDIYGNRIESELIDYYADYNTNINTIQEKECIPVVTKKGQSDFIIPDQYNTEKYLTNAYNIDYSRIINPYTY